MKGFYFGDRDRYLYGAYDAAPSRHRAEGAVFCYPLGIEYQKTHRAFRRLAAELARMGVHVLRFDYTATGDSWGAAEDASIPQWIDDISAAMTELRDMADVSRVSLVGFRLGATLAAATAAQTRNVTRLVLWDPILRGDRYAAELLALGGGADEFCTMPDRSCALLSAGGFDLSERLLTEIGQLDLTALDALPVDRIDVISSSQGDGAAELVADLSARDVVATLRPVGAEGWGAGGDFSSAVLNPEVTRELLASFADRRVS